MINNSSSGKNMVATLVLNKKTGPQPVCNLIGFITGKFVENFAQSGEKIQLPDSFYAMDGFPKNPAFSHMWANTIIFGTNYTVKAALRWSINLQITTLEITWEKGKASTLVVKEKHLQLNTAPTTTEMDAYEAAYNPLILAYCKANMGKMVGKGQCGELAIAALTAAGAKAPPTMPIMPVLGIGRTWGYCIYAQNSGEKFNNTDFAIIRPGDIIQITDFYFKWNESPGLMGAAGLESGPIQHTAIVTKVLGSQKYKEGGHVIIVEQNGTGGQIVCEGFLIFGALTRGKIEVFRSVSATWGGLLEASFAAGKVAWE